MTETRKEIITPSENKHSGLIAAAASLSILPIWYPFFEKSLYQRAVILKSKTPNDLSHTSFFRQKRNYYRGITANILTMQPLIPAAEWTLKTLLKKIEDINNRAPNVAEKFVAGFITGNATALIANPYETLNIAVQQNRETPVKAFLRILRESGAKGFYTGAMPMAIRNGAFISSLLVTSPELKKQLDQWLPQSVPGRDLLSTTFGAVIPASIFTCMVIPFDIAAIMQQSDPTKKKFNSAVNALKMAYSAHGSSAIKTGTLMRFLACNIEMIGFNLLNTAYNDIYDKMNDSNRLTMK